MVIVDGRLAAFDTTAFLQTAQPLLPHRLGGSPRARRRRLLRACGEGARDFFIVGHPKSGTTALYEMLRRHPQIFMPAGKEPWFFARELHERTPPRPEGTPATLEQYLALFAAARPGQRVGEASALYLWSRTAARGIAEVSPRRADRRDPARARLSCARCTCSSSRPTSRPRPTCARRSRSRQPGARGARCRATPTGRRRCSTPSTCATSSSCAATTSCSRREQMLVLIYDDFRADNEATVRRVLRFLEVDDGVPIEPVEANPRCARARSACTSWCTRSPSGAARSRWR